MDSLQAPCYSAGMGKAKARAIEVVMALAVFSCGAGPYGYSRTYTPLDSERAALNDSEPYDPVMARRLPAEWAKKNVHLFGVVLERDEAPGGKTDLLLSVRRLAARNLCENSSEDSCRVTVGDHEMTRVHALVILSPADRGGEQKLTPRSLIRLVGQLQPDPNPKDGNAVLTGNFYRHWPSDTYVTEQAREYMRR